MKNAGRLGMPDYQPRLVHDQDQARPTQARQSKTVTMSDPIGDQFYSVTALRDVEAA